MSLLTPALYPEIRLALAPDGSVTDTELPDATLVRDIFTGQAERRVLALVPTAASLAGVDLTLAQTAAIYFAAALVAAQLPTVTQQQVGDVRETYGAQSVAERVALLEAEAFRALSALSSGLPLSEVPTLFAVACGRRGY